VNFPFRKYHGAGNDFVLFYKSNPSVAFDADTIKVICDRRYGVGSDGLLVVEVLRRDHLRIDFYNPDGSVSFCGNGARCALRMAHDDGLINDCGNFIGSDGEHSYVIEAEDVELNMYLHESPISIQSDWYVNTGSPHLVMFRKGIDALDMVQIGRDIRYSDRWKDEGVNVNLVEWIGDVLTMRTYERGVENETLSCGTGVTAAAICAGMERLDLSALNVITRGGLFRVRWSRSVDDVFTDVKLKGPTKFVFEGSWAMK
jgi:diaminopimelate epimerase